MNFNLKIIFTFLTILFCSCVAQSQQKNKPNVIIIYTDDQGAVDLGCYGSDDIYTPNIDALATNGTRFTQSYVAAPVCAPSRASLLTGKYPQSAGVPGNTSATPGSHGLPKNNYTIGDLFKDNGYQTAHIGKWHLGMSAESSPNEQGFEYSFGHLRGCIDNYSHFFYWEGPNTHDLFENGKEVYYDGQYFPDLASNKALQYVTDKKDSPFFMYYAINMPHYPYQPTQKWRDYYKNSPQPRADYAAFISTIDERIGFLVDHLKKLNILDNTIIIYQSDNGYSTETRAFGGGGNSGPYRGAKSSLFEGGLRLPTIISWPDGLPKNKVNNEFMVNFDWMPTLSNLCGFKTVLKNIDGIDVSQMIQDPKITSPRKSAFWKYGSQWVVRKGKWKLIGHPKDTSHKGKLDPEKDALFLSDLSSDVSEMTNLAHKYPEIVKELIRDYESWEHSKEGDIPRKTASIHHLGIAASIQSLNTLHPNFSNLEVLIDGKRGYADYSSGQWIGLEQGNLEFIIDLKALKEIKNIEIGYLQSTGNWIFPPKQIEISFSKNNKTFGIPIRLNPEITSKKSTGTLQVKTQQKTQFIKLKIQGIGTCPPGHPGDGNPAWFFIDEIIIQ